MEILTQIDHGKTVTLVSIHGGRHMRAKLCHMGLLPGASFTVLNVKGKGPIMVKVKETRLAIGRGMAEKMMVK